MDQDRIRLSDAERDAAAADLAHHYGEGRLTAEEHAERLDAIWTARTRSDLAPIFADLPRRQAPRPERPEARRRRPRLPLLPVVAVLVLLSVVTRLPFWVLIFVLFGCGLLGRSGCPRTGAA